MTATTLSTTDVAALVNRDHRTVCSWARQLGLSRGSGTPAVWTLTDVRVERYDQLARQVDPDLHRADNRAWKLRDTMDGRRCDECGRWTRDPHEPHDHGCARPGDCTCDHVTCPGCCWDCQKRMVPA